MKKMDKKGSGNKPDSVTPHQAEGQSCIFAIHPEQFPSEDGGRAGNPYRSLCDLAPNGVYPAVPLSRKPGGLLHHLFTLTP